MHRKHLDSPIFAILFNPYLLTLKTENLQSVPFPIDKKGESNKIRYTVSGIYHC